MTKRTSLFKLFIHLAAFAALPFIPLHLFAAPAKPVVVVAGYSSIEHVGERPYAASVARHVSKWLEKGGVGNDVCSDTNLTTCLKGRKVAILIYCEKPDDKQIAAISSFADKGGKLIVMYSLSPELGKIVGVNVGSYVKLDGGSFSSMSFNDAAPRHVPKSIAQGTMNVITASPVKGRSKVIGTWNDQNGKATPHPAWLSSDKGFWMTHLLVADGDFAAKRRLLVALCASAHPSLWTDVARFEITSAAKCGDWATPSDALAKLNAARYPSAKIELTKARDLMLKANDAIVAGHGSDAYQMAMDMRKAMESAYKIVHKSTPPAGEIRAVWDHSGTGNGNWKATCEALSRKGVTDLFVKVAGPGFAHCDIKAAPKSYIFQQRGDQLAAAIAAAKPYGIKVHAWIICFSTTQATQQRLKDIEPMLLLDPDGKRTGWLNPANPSVSWMVRAIVAEIASKYNVEGIHLDFVRYPSMGQSIGDETRKLFEAHIKTRLDDWPDDVWSGKAKDEFSKWRAGFIEKFVADARRGINNVKPGLALSVAVYGKYPSCMTSVGQDWIKWLKAGTVDYAFPMDYTEDPAVFRKLMAEHAREKSLARRIVPGIGVTATESELSLPQLIDQINATRDAKLGGYALFSLSPSLLAMPLQ